MADEARYDRYENEAPVSLAGIDYGTRLGRIQAAWWLQDHGADTIIVTPAEREAYEGALRGDDMGVSDAADLVRFVGRLYTYVDAEAGL